MESKKDPVDIPLYPERRGLALADKPILDAAFSLLQPRISEFTFANLYLFRKAHHYELSMVKDALVVFGRGYGGEEYFLPPMGVDIEPALAELFGASLTLYGVDEQFLNGIPSLMNDLEINEDRDSFDYLYLRQELAELPGNSFHKKKNRISYFTRRHEYLIEPIAPQHLEGALRFWMNGEGYVQR